MVAPTVFDYICSTYVQQNQKCNQLSTAIVAQGHKPANMAARGYVMSSKSLKHLSVELPELSLVSQQPRCFLVSFPGGQPAITSDPPRLQVCHNNCALHSDKWARNNKPQLHCIYASVFVCVCVCDRSVRRQCVLQCQGLCFLWLPISCLLLSASPWFSRTHACTVNSHTAPHTRGHDDKGKREALRNV